MDGEGAGSSRVPHRSRAAPPRVTQDESKMKAEGLIRSHSQVAVGQVRSRDVATAKDGRTLRSSKRRLRSLADEVMGEQTS